MSVFDFEVFRDKPDEPPASPCPAKIIVLALARDHRGLRAKMMAETLYKSFPKEYREPLIKFFPDVGWRETLIKLKKASKKWDYAATVAVFLDKKLIGDDDDFSLHIRETHHLLVDSTKLQIFKDISLLDQLQIDPRKTYIYFDVAINYKNVGRMIFQIESDCMPKSTNGFLELCCSQKFPLPEVNFRRSRFAGSLIRRIVKEGWIQVSTIDDIRVYAKGKYEKPVLSHNRRGTISLNVDKKGRLGSHLFIILDHHPWMDSMYRAIGYLIDGEYVLHTIENVETSYESPKVDVIISDNGILHSPVLINNEGFLTSDMLEAESRFKTLRDEYKEIVNEYVNITSFWKDDFSSELQNITEKSEDKEESKIMVSQNFGNVIGEWFSDEQVERMYEETELGESTFAASSEQILSKSKIGDVSSSSQNSKSEVRLESTLEAVSSKMSEINEKGDDDEVEGVLSAVSEKGPEDEVEVQVEEIEEEEVQEWQIITEPDIQYTYIVPHPMVDFRVGYKKFDTEKYVHAYQKIGLHLPGKYDSDDALPLIPFDQVKQNVKFDYYEVSKNAMNQVTPKLLLAWAMRIDDGEELREIKKAISELLLSVTGGDTVIEPNTHNLDAISFEDYPERYKQCLLSLPTHLLQLLKESLQEIKEWHVEEPVLVAGDSTSTMKLKGTKPKQKPPSEDVISGCMLTLLEFTRRMIDSCTELVPNMDNYDFVMGLIDEVILKKVQRFIRRKKKMDQRFKKKLEYNRYHRPGHSSNSSLEDVKKSSHGISYWLDLEKCTSTPTTPAPSWDSDK